MTPQMPLVAYVDPSALIPEVLGEELFQSSTRRRLDGFPHLMSSDFLEAELRVAFKREQEDFDTSSVSSIAWIFPNRRMDPEMARVLEISELSPARVWHLATALFFSEVLQSEMAFITLDEQQETVARELGFPIP